jgi:hypothetical protein
MSRPLLLLVFAWAGAYSAGCDHVAIPTENEMVVAPDSAVLATVVAAYRPTLLDTIALGFPKSLAVHGDTIVVVDRDQLVSVMNREFELIGRWSRRGEGPGEVSNPLSVDRVEGGWQVADGGNARLQRFTDAGADLGSTPAHVGLRRTAPVPRGTLVHGSGGTYVDLVGPDGSVSPWGPSLSSRDTARIEQEMVVFDKHFFGRFEDGVVILDGETGELWTVGLDGAPRTHWELTPALREDVFAGTGASSDDTFGVSTIAYRPAFAAMDVDPGGDWVVVVPGRQNPLGPGPIFIDLRTGRWHPSRIDIDESEWENPNDIIDITLERGRLHVISGPWDGSILSVSVQLPPTG